MKSSASEPGLRKAPNTCSSIRRVFAESSLTVPFIQDSLRLMTDESYFFSYKLPHCFLHGQFR